MDRPLSIPAILDQAAEVSGDCPIVSRGIDGGIHRQSLAATRARVLRLAASLSATGTAAGDRVATLAWNGYRHFELDCGISGVGAVCHTVHTRGATTEVERAAFREMLGLRDGDEALFRRVLADGNADGTLDAPAVALAGRTILSALNGLPDWYRERPDGEAPAAIARKTARYIVDGVRRADGAV